MRSSAALAKQAGITVTEVSIQDIGPTWGAEISRKALFGLVIVLIAIMIYISFRFEWKMAVGAIIALLHDVLITIGVYALVGREVTPETVIAILTILGFSLYDTVVIYDKIRENTESSALVSKLGYDGVVDLSLNQTFMRSVNTSLVVLLPILSLLLFGGRHPEGLRVRDVHRGGDRRLLLDLHRGPGAHDAEEARQALSADRGPSHRAHPDGHHRACREHGGRGEHVRRGRAGHHRAGRSIVEAQAEEQEASAGQAEAEVSRWRSRRSRP